MSLRPRFPLSSNIFCHYYRDRTLLLAPTKLFHTSKILSTATPAEHSHYDTLNLSQFATRSEIKKSPLLSPPHPPPPPPLYKIPLKHIFLIPRVTDDSMNSQSYITQTATVLTLTRQKNSFKSLLPTPSSQIPNPVKNMMMIFDGIPVLSSAIRSEEDHRRV
jgi:hypothetical protein